MSSYRTRSLISFFTGLVLILGGMLLILSGEHLKENFGFILFGLGGIFWGIMAAIRLGAETTKDTTQNVIDILKHQGIIPSDSGIRVNEDLQVVKPVTKSTTFRHNIEEPIKKNSDTMSDNN